MNIENLGSKIKALRKARGLTQAELAGGHITRNMLSKIETGIATPSLETLDYIADTLNVSASYLLSEDTDLVTYEKNEQISKIYRAFRAKSYHTVIDIAKRISGTDDELALLLATSHFCLAKEAVKNGALITAEEHLNKSREYSHMTAHSTEHIEAHFPIYYAIIRNIQSPLLEFDPSSYVDAVSSVYSYEFFKYLTLDSEYKFENPVFSLHIEAKNRIRERDYPGAIITLTDALDKAKLDYDSFVVFGIYGDLELCYKQICDYENAYLYSSKRMSMLEGFKT